MNWPNLKVSKSDKPMIANRMWSSFSRGMGDMRLLLDYAWVEDFLLKNSILAELDDLKKMRQKTQSLPPTKDDLLILAKKYFDEYVDDRKQRIQKAMAGIMVFKNVSPFRKLSAHGLLYSNRTGTFQFFGHLDWKEIVAAIKDMPQDPASLSEKDKAATLAHIEKRLQVLKMELEEIYPKDSMFRRGGDIRTELVKYWTKVQKKCDGPVSPSGSHIKYSPEKEQKAYKQLGIDAFINKNALFRPFDPNDN